MLLEKRLQLRPRDEIYAIVEIDVSRSANDEQLFWIRPEPVSMFAEDPRVRLIPGDEQNRTGGNPVQALERPKQGHLSVAGPRKGRRRTRMLAARRAVVVVKLPVDGSGLNGQGLRRADDHGAFSTIHFGPALRGHLPEILMQRRFIHRFRKALPLGLADIVHADGGYRLDARINLRRRKTETAAAAHADHTDTFAVHERQAAKEIDACAEILHQRFRRRDAMRLSAAFADIGRIMRDRDKAALGHGLCVKPRRLLLHRAKGRADDQRRMFPRAVERLRNVQIRDQRNAETVVIRHLAVIDAIALRKCLVPRTLVCASAEVSSSVATPSAAMVVPAACKSLRRAGFARLSCDFVMSVLLNLTRAAFNSTYPTEPIMGVRNLAPKRVGRKEYLMAMPAMFKGESLTRQTKEVQLQ
jgi:hypothetical protein